MCVLLLYRKDVVVGVTTVIDMGEKPNDTVAKQRTRTACSLAVVTSCDRHYLIYPRHAGLPPQTQSCSADTCTSRQGYREPTRGVAGQAG